jgi:hypothetical protein
MIATFVGLFVGIPLLFWFSSAILIDVGTIFLMIFAAGGLGLVQWRFVRDHLDMHYNQFAMYAFTGFGLILVNFLLFLNLSIPISSRSETYDIRTFSFSSNLEVRVGDSETSSFAKNMSHYMESHYNELPPDLEKMKTVTITFEKGLLGFDVISNCEFR